MLGDRPLLPTRPRTKARRKLEDERKARNDLRARHRAAAARLTDAEREHTAAQAELERARHQALAYGTDVPASHQKRAKAAADSLREAAEHLAGLEGAMAHVDEKTRGVAAANYQQLIKEVDAYYRERADSVRRHAQAITDELAALKDAAIARTDLAHAAGDTDAIRRMIHPPRDLHGLAENGLAADLVPEPEPVTAPDDAPMRSPVMEVWSPAAPVATATEQPLHVWDNGERVL